MKSKKSSGEFGNCVDIYCLEIPSSWGGGGYKIKLFDSGRREQKITRNSWTVYGYFAASDPYNFSFSCKLIVAKNS